MDYKYELDYSAIAGRIKAARKSAGLTQAELAEKVNLSTNAVAKLETSLMNASLQTLVNLANTLNVDINYFLCDMDGDRDDGVDTVLQSALNQLSKKDKLLLLHIINGLNMYQENNRE